MNKKETVKYNYNLHGSGYTKHRRTEPKIAEKIHSALGNAKTVLNVGAGSGSYEPPDRYVIAVEPSAVMRSLRPEHFPPAINASAENLPFDDNSFDASMAVLTVHHWNNPETGLIEMRRVTKGTVVIVTFDTNAISNFWLYDYAPEIVEYDKERFPTIQFITDVLGGKCSVQSVLLPRDCADGIQEGFYARPEAFLDEEIRKSQSTWKFIPEGIEERVVKALKHDLDSGEWDKKYGKFRSMPEYPSALRIITSIP